VFYLLQIHAAHLQRRVHQGLAVVMVVVMVMVIVMVMTV
jgi:hypothetical protein